LTKPPEPTLLKQEIRGLYTRDLSLSLIMVVW
jgi:hypothetical protein